MTSLSDVDSDSASADHLPRILPEGGHEIAAIVLISMNDQTHVMGNLCENVQDLPNVLARLGTKVSDSYPSSVGFRVFLRTEKPNGNNGSRSLEDHYHIFSCLFNPDGNMLSYSAISDEEQKELLRSRPYSETFSASLTIVSDQTLYRMSFKASDTNGFIISHHGPELQTVNGRVRKIEKLLPFITYARKVSLFFRGDDFLISHLDRAIKNNGIGARAPSWKDSLVIPRFASNWQTRMVTGSTDILNSLHAALREELVKDGSRTSVECRQQAKAFRNFIHETYTTVRREPSHKVYPVMLNVTDGLCSEMPFGASMVNKENSYAGINALHGLLKANIVGEDIAIVTLYPGQADIYRDALKKCHRYAPAKGYNTVKVGKLEDCVGTDYGIVIVDLVRTANSSGNLGFLSQARRLQLLLTIHRNGLIVVGDRQCTVTSHSRSSTTKLEKVLRWFSDNGRVVGVANGLPTSDPQSTPASSLPPTPTESLPARTYVGLPELWHLEIQEAANKKDRILRAGPTPPQDIEAVRASFARQGFFKTEQDNTMAKGADRKATVIDKSKDLPRDQAPYNANVTRMEASSNSRQSSMAKRISPSTTGGFSPEKSQSRTNFESSARSSGKSKATDDAFSRFQARLKRQGNFPPGPMMNVTEHTRKKNDLAVRSPSPASLSTSTGALAPNPLAKPQAVKAELSVRNLNIGESRIQAEAPIQKAFGKPQSIITEVSGRDDFNTQYRSKYKGIRSIFDTLHRSTEASPNENQLFRRLGEAYIMEDIDEFETVYTELLHLASGIAVSG